MDAIQPLPACPDRYEESSEPDRPPEFHPEASGEGRYLRRHDGRGNSDSLPLAEKHSSTFPLIFQSEVCVTARSK
jgi:hypothetical protein